MNAEHNACAPSAAVEHWGQIDWKRCEWQVARLQARIVKASQMGRWGKVKVLQRLLTCSFSGKALAVKRVTENKGKRTQQREANTIASQTASLIEFAKNHDLEAPQERVFEDDGYSGATLERPGLEGVRDLAAEGQIQVALAYAPDRLSRKYAYQILLIEELARNGVETLFVKAPQGSSAEDQLLVKFQGKLLFEL